MNKVSNAYETFNRTLYFVGDGDSRVDHSGGIQMVNWLFIPTWSVIVLLLIGLGWVVWNFDQEVENLEKENAGLRNRITKLEGDKQ